MNDCDKIRQNAFLYHENALEGAQQAEVQRHLEGCLACRTHFQQTIQLKKALKRLPRYRTSADFNTVLRARLRTEAYRKPFIDLSALTGLWRVPAFAALALLFISVGVVLQRNWSLAPTLGTGNNLTALRSAEPIQIVQQSPIPVKTNVIRRSAVKNYVEPGTLQDTRRWVGQQPLRQQEPIERLIIDSTRQGSSTTSRTIPLVHEARQIRF